MWECVGPLWARDAYEHGCDEKPEYPFCGVKEVSSVFFWVYVMLYATGT